MADSMMSKAATMEIPINSNGDSRNLAEDDSLEQVSDTLWFRKIQMQFIWTHPVGWVLFLFAKSKPYQINSVKHQNVDVVVWFS